MTAKYYAWSGINTSSGAQALLISNFQTLSINRGRNWQIDPFSPSTATLVFRGALTFAIGQWILVTDAKTTTGVFDDPSGLTVFLGTVKDTRIEYGMVSNLDYTTVVLEQVFARWGRRQFTNRVIAQANSMSQISTLATAIGFNTFTYTNGTGRSIMSGQTYSGNGVDLINQIQQTEMGHVADGDSYTLTPVGGSFETTAVPRVDMFPRNYSQTTTRTFADDSTAAGIRYEKIEFTSAAQQYFTEATINPLALASQTSGSGFYNLTQDSLDYTTAQALSHAQYLVAKYNSTTPVPISITATYSQQNTTTRQDQFDLLVVQQVGRVVTIIFRGNTYLCVVEGVEVAADVSDVTVTLSLSAFDNNNYLILNDAVFGTLGTSGTYPGNKLGF